MYSGSLFNTLSIHWDRAQMLKKSPYDKYEENALFFFFCDLQLITLLLLIRDSFMRTQGSSLYMCVRYFPYPIPFGFS